MQLDKIEAITQTIKEYDKIIIFRHKRPDGDAVGSTMGLCGILRLTYPDKDVRVINDDRSGYLGFLGEEDEPVSDSHYEGALGIVIDTANSARISNPKYSLCEKLIKIDHHIPIESYGDINWEDEEKSSASEMIAELYFANQDEYKIDKNAATFIYCGMVTDSGRFRFPSVKGDTMRYAGMLLDFGVETETLFANLYMKDFGLYKFEANVYKKMKITENGVAYIFVDKKMQERFGLTKEDAGAAVSYMDSIKGSLIWIAFIELDDEVRVRIRSRFVTINKLAEKYSGGGHACAAGATVYSKREANKLVREADAILAEYKATHEGWL